MTIKNLINILEPNEIEYFFGCPVFNDKERGHYFSLSAFEQNLATTLSSTTRWYFILQLGYFKIKKQFFTVDLHRMSNDITFITKYYNCAYPSSSVSEETHLKIRNLILTSADHNSKSITNMLEKKVKEIVLTTTNPKLIFKALYEHAANSKSIIPQYSTFQKIIGQSLKQEEERLQGIVEKHLSQQDRVLLQQLLSTTGKYYEITLIKQDQKNFRYSQVQKGIEQKSSYDKLYKSAKKLIPKLAITQGMIDYYASMIKHYPVYKLKRLQTFTTYLYLMCYIHRRMQKLNDNLMNSFVYYVDKYNKLGKEYGENCVYTAKSELNKNIRTKLPKLLKLFLDSNIPDEEIRRQGLKIMPQDKLEEVIAYITKEYIEESDYQWQFIVSKKHEIVKNLRPIFKVIDFECRAVCSNLQQAITFLKNQFNQENPLNKVDHLDIPVDFIPKSTKPYIYNLDDTNENIQLTKYEFCAYDQIRKKFRVNDVTIQDSINHKSLDADLIPKQKIETIIKELNHPLLSTPFKDELERAKKHLDELYYKVHYRIENNINKSVKVEQRNGKPHIILQYNAKEDLTNHDFFKKLPRVNLIEILDFCHRKTNFLNAFTHIKPYYAKTKKDNKFILAAILADGQHYGINKMSSISDLDYQSLFNAEHNFIRLETLKLANDFLCKDIFELHIFKYWNIDKDLLHGGVDAQKFVTRIEIVTARNSAKYFPLKKGIAAYTLLANYIPLSVETISPNLHESYFLYDIVKNLSVDIKLDYISGDDHSINPVNFLLCRYLPVGFAPHLVNINKKIKNLYSFDHPNTFTNLLIKPHKQLKTNLILEEENNMNWIIASLIKGEVKQSIIVRKLSALSKYNRTCQAMAEYNRVFESIYTLDYIDQPESRKSVRAAQNRIEAYHQMRRAIALGNNGEFRGNSELELDIWNQCARLLANAIIYYNGCLLSETLKKYQVSIDTIKRVSPLAWAHINMGGKFEFLVETPSINIEEMIANAGVILES